MALYCKVPKAKVKPLKEQHPRPERPGPAAGVGARTSASRLPLSPATSHALVLLPAGSGRARGCRCKAHTLALYNFPILRGDQRPPVQKQISTRKSNNPGEEVGFALPLRIFPQNLFTGVGPPGPPKAVGTGCVGAATSAASTCARRARTSCGGEEPAGIASRLRGSGLGCCPSPSLSVEWQQ